MIRLISRIISNVHIVAKSLSARMNGGEFFPSNLCIQIQVSFYIYWRARIHDKRHKDFPAAFQDYPIAYMK